MARDGAVIDISWPGADHHLGSDHAVLALPGTSTWHPQGAASTQAGDQLAFQRSTALDIEGLVDRLMRDPHRLIIRELDRQPACDLLWAPGGGPAPVLAARLVPAVPRQGPRPRDELAAGCADHSGQPVLHVLAQPLVHHQLGGLGAGCTAIPVPLRDHGPVDERAATGTGVAPQLP